MTRQPHHIRLNAYACLLAGVLALAVPGVAEAQVDLPPTITLETAPPTTGAEAQVAVPAEPRPDAPPVPDDSSPIIQLRLPSETASDVAAEAAAPLAVERDRATTPASGQYDRLLPLTVDPRISRQVRIGDSLTAPGILRLTGETAEAQLSLTLPADTSPPAELQLSLRSGVDVLIGSAALAVSINGGEPVELPLRSIGDFAQATLPAAGLRVGSNSISLTVKQPHRISCGPDASFQVWTEVNLAESGVQLPLNALRADVEGFRLAMEAQLAHGGALDLLVDQGVDLTLLRRASYALMAGLEQRERLRIVSFYDDAPPRFAAVALIAADRSAVSYRIGATGAIILQIEYRGDELPDIAGALPTTERKVEGPPRVVPGRPVTLAELGSADIIGKTHYFRRDIAFALPDDWLLLANQKARLTLRYGYARQLPVGALLLVKVNNQTVRLLPLDRDGGRVLPPLPVGFDANLLHPGRNTLSFEMMVPGDPPDEACPVRTTDMMVVLAESALDVPSSPSMTLPGIAGTISGLQPANVIVPSSAAGDAGLQAISIRLASALSLPSQPREAVTLTIVRLSEVGSVPLDVAGVSQGQLQALLFPRQPSAAEATAIPAPAASPYVLEAPAAARAATEPGLLSRLWIRTTGWLFSHEGIWRNVESFRETAFQGSELSLSDWIVDRQGEALLWRPDIEAPDSLWLIVGPRVQIDEVADQLQGLIASRSAVGEAAVLLTDGTWDIWTPIRPPLLSEPLAAGNLRTVVGNYASWSPMLFTMCLLALALLSALPALFYVLTSREPKGRS
ncbi:cellulose biosynthesis cyclic di-GMP-binding regulatory protein BcsB [Paracoccus tibetensis]|uniref:Cyclic di-GMP-binding protein n=1 Tax=Paracoccus tibetensis TaxID=336292 RepID=A0A1G5DP08_9RHOB|nr:cellulose biosynthesis cyclic di-GMP-binding regulatory protein BcsB [Paracoccus tibetensis]SCY16180.1 cellulose synthase subunit [Paracoccus tibetensis]